MGMSRWLVVTALAGLCMLAYGPALFLPFIADDYVQIRLARHFVSIEGWSALASDALYRCRATSLLLTYWTDRIFGLNELAFYASSQLLHLLNTLLVFSLGAWRAIGWRVSTIAAAFFAIYQGHQEAVMWYSALPELLVFLFAVACFLFWVLWLQSDGRHAYYAASLVCFGLALLSKESAVAVVGLLALAICVERTQWRRRILWLTPFAALAVVYAALIFAARNTHLHFNDAGTFSITQGNKYR